MGKTYIYIGAWNKPSEFGTCGITVAEYDPREAKITPIATQFPQISCGAMKVDPQKKILYVADERREIEGKTFGGMLYAFAIRPETGMLMPLSAGPAFGVQPSFVEYDGAYLLETNHATDQYIIRTERDEDGKLHAVKMRDESSVVLFERKADGSVGEALDVLTFDQKEWDVPEAGSRSARNSHIHAVAKLPGTERYVVTDKGLDAVYTLAIDEGSKTLDRIGTWKSTAGSSPRYLALHPSKPLLYLNYETRSVLSVLEYDRNGILRERAMVPASGRYSREEDTAPSDIAVDQAGENLYLLLRGKQEISWFALDSEGIPNWKANIAMNNTWGGRKLAFSPDGRFLLAAGFPDDELTVFEITKDGEMVYAGKRNSAHPGALAFFEA
ncbi:MAG: lactonase family protein [Faecousia sp.]